MPSAPAAAGAAGPRHRRSRGHRPPRTSSAPRSASPSLPAHGPAPRLPGSERAGVRPAVCPPPSLPGPATAVRRPRRHLPETSSSSGQPPVREHSIKLPFSNLRSESRRADSCRRGAAQRMSRPGTSWRVGAGASATSGQRSPGSKATSSDHRRHRAAQVTSRRAVRRMRCVTPGGAARRSCDRSAGVAGMTSWLTPDRRDCRRPSCQAVAVREMTDPRDRRARRLSGRGTRGILPPCPAAPDPG